MSETAERLLPWPTLSQANSQGSTNQTVITNVYALQWLLLQWNSSYPGLIADGDFGSYTTAAVQAFQSARGLYIDGIAGPITLAALIVDVQYGSVNNAVKAVQHLLSKIAMSVFIDGVFGTETLTYVRTF